MSTGSWDGKGGDELLELAIHIGRVRASGRSNGVALLRALRRGDESELAHPAQAVLQPPEVHESPTFGP